MVVCPYLKRIQGFLGQSPGDAAATAAARELLRVVQGLAETRIRRGRLLLSSNSSSELLRGLGQFLLPALDPPTAPSSPASNSSAEDCVDPLEEFVWELSPAVVDLLSIQNWPQHQGLSRMVLRLFLDRLSVLLNPKELLLALQSCLALPFLDRNEGQSSPRTPRNLQLLGMALYRGLLTRSGLTFVQMSGANSPPIAQPGWQRFPAGGCALFNVWNELLVTHPRSLAPMYSSPLLGAIRQRFFNLPIVAPRLPDGRFITRQAGRPPESALWSPVVWLEVDPATPEGKPSPMGRLFGLPTLLQAYELSHGGGETPADDFRLSEEFSLVLGFLRSGQLTLELVETLAAYTGFLQSITDLVLLGAQLHSGVPVEANQGLFHAEFDRLKKEAVLVDKQSMGRHDGQQQLEVQRGVLREACVWLGGLWAQLALLVPQIDLDGPVERQQQSRSSGLAAAWALLSQGIMRQQLSPPGSEDDRKMDEPRAHRGCTAAPLAARQLIGYLGVVQGGGQENVEDGVWEFLRQRIMELDAPLQQQQLGTTMIQAATSNESLSLTPATGELVDSMLAFLLAAAEDLSDDEFTGRLGVSPSHRPNVLEALLRLATCRLRKGHPVAMYTALRIVHRVVCAVVTSTKCGPLGDHDSSPGEAGELVSEAARSLLGFMQFWSEPWSRKQLARETFLRLPQLLGSPLLRLEALVALFRPLEEGYQDELSPADTRIPPYLFHAGLVSVSLNAISAAAGAWAAAVASTNAATSEETLSPDVETLAAEGNRLLAELFPLLRRHVLGRPHFRPPTRPQAGLEEGKGWAEAVSRWKECGALDAISACSNLGLSLRRLAPALGGRGGTSALPDWPRPLCGAVFRELGETLRQLRADLHESGPGGAVDPFLDLQLEMQLSSLKHLESS